MSTLPFDLAPEPSFVEIERAVQPKQVVVSRSNGLALAATNFLLSLHVLNDSTCMTHVTYAGVCRSDRIVLPAQTDRIFCDLQGYTDTGVNLISGVTLDFYPGTVATPRSSTHLKQVIVGLHGDQRTGCVVARLFYRRGVPFVLEGESPVVMSYEHMLERKQALLALPQP